MTVKTNKVPDGYRQLAPSTSDCSADDNDTLRNAKLTYTLTQYRGQFLRFLQSRLGNRDEAEDVLQDFHLKVLKKSSQIRDPGSTVAWLRTVLKSVLADHFRRKYAERNAMQLIAAELPTQAPDSIEIENENEEFDRTACDCFYRLLPTLKAGYADVLSRVDLSEQPRDDAARALGITSSNLRVRLHRARQALKEKLETSCGKCREHDCFGKHTLSGGSGVQHLHAGNSP